MDIEFENEWETTSDWNEDDDVKCQELADMFCDGGLTEKEFKEKVEQIQM